MCSHVERCLCTRLITGCNILVLGTCLQDCTIFWFWNWLPEILRFLSLMGRRGTHWWRTSLPWVPWVSGGDPDPEIVYKMSCVWAYGDTGVIRVVTAEVLLHCKAPVPCSFLYSPLCFLCLFLEKAEWACTKEEMKLLALCVLIARQCCVFHLHSHKHGREGRKSVWTVSLGRLPRIPSPHSIPHDDWGHHGSLGGNWKKLHYRVSALPQSPDLTGT